MKTVLLATLDFLNNNQGLIAALGIVISILLGLIVRKTYLQKTKIKHIDKSKNKEPYIKVGGNISAGGDIVSGDKYQRSETQDRHPFIEITLGTRSSSQGKYEITLKLRNVGDASATLQNIDIAGETIPIQKRTLAPGDQPIDVRHEISGYKIRKQKIENPKIRVSYKDLNGKLYETKAKIIQGPMAVGTSNIDEIEDNEFHILTEEQK